MNKQVELIRAKVKLLEKDGKKLITDYKRFGWKDTRPKEYKEQVIYQKVELFDVIDGTTTIPKKKQIPAKFQNEFQKWYSSCIALVENNFNKERIQEFKGIYQNPLKGIVTSGYITKEMGFTLIDSIREQINILNSLPEYIEHKSIDLEMEIASTLMDDELSEAEYLLGKGFTRASGAIAGVVLERHLKNLCDKHSPTIKYPKKATISKLNDLLKEQQVLDIPDWRRIQFLGDIRNKCDHASNSPPTKEEVTDLISEVKKIIHFY